MNILPKTIIDLSKNIEGDLLSDFLSTTIYSTDASAYKEKPLAVVIPKNKQDVKTVIKFADSNNISIIPRTAGTSLAGQVVGGGIVVDCSKYMNKVLEINKEEKWVRVEPGVVLDELNIILKEYGLFFGPETSTSNRCMMGGMVGNNSCGAHSLVYGSTRDHTLELNVILSDGSEAKFGELTKQDFENKCQLENLEGDIYRKIKSQLSPKNIRDRIKEEFPDPEIERRNTGYAIDLLSEMEPFQKDGKIFNFCSLICGSEGTLAFITEIKLNLVPLPPKHKGLLAIHHASIEEAMDANIIALKHNPVAIELIDKYLLDCTKNSREHVHNRFFLEGDPGALLCVELAEESEEEIKVKSEALIEELKSKGYGFNFPLIFGNDISRVWALRKAGLGLLSNIPGDAKPQPVIEDTAVSPQKLPEYIAEFNKTLKKNNLDCVYYAHIATGELHLRPIINLKEDEGVRLFRLVADEISRLVKKYRGSLSGEHGDGRLRGEFIPFMIGDENYELLREIKKTWDPKGVFNQGKITDTPPMDTSLRFIPGKPTPEIETIFDFSDSLGMVRLAEKCNGSADCRKSEIIGGTMCPSFQATRDERNTTRARANMLREVINSDSFNGKFDNPELYDVLDLCLSCKGCKTECPSGVDMAKLKSEYLYQYYRTSNIPLRTRAISAYSKMQGLASHFAGIYNFITEKKITSNLLKGFIGFAKARSLPKVYRQTWKKWINRNLDDLNSSIENANGEVFLFVDEFTNFNEVPLGINTCKLLNRLGYKINIVDHQESGRAKISKGFLKQAKELAASNVNMFHEVVTNLKPLIGVEPSAILSFRDEYPDLLRNEEKQKAIELAKNVFTIEEFLSQEFHEGRIKSEFFTEDKKLIHYHGHCQQKALVGTNHAKSVLSIPKNYVVDEINTGCCGMAGSFGYEKEHFDLSMKVGELVLFPAVRNADGKDLIVASGTSCRHQIKDGTSKKSQHPIEVLFEALK